MADSPEFRGLVEQVKWEREEEEEALEIHVVGKVRSDGLKVIGEGGGFGAFPF